MVGRTSGATCGLIAKSAADTAVVLDGLSRSPCRASALISFEGSGSTTAIFAGSRPSLSQPSSMALPILPAPTSRTVPGRLTSG